MIRLSDKGRVDKAKNHILRGLALSDDARRAYLAETDDEREWVPFGNMHVDIPKTAVIKCDLCAGFGDNPRCAMFCPTKCLSVEMV
ncbi:MAG: hypothetical protein ACOC1F_05175 [Myxococcota bacterium]